PVPYSAFLLGNPYRLVIDLPEVSWGVNGDTKTMKGVVTNLRYGLFRAGNSRIVVDLKSPVKLVEHDTLVKPDRIVFDLAPVGKAAFRSGKKFFAPNWTPPKRARPIQPTPKKQGDTRRIIVIDAGHGGVDPGAIRAGVYEKRLTLRIANEVKRALEATGRYRVVVTRRRDVFLELRQRVEVARANKGELFLSLHADTARKRATRGASVYTLSNKASDRETAELVAKENRVDAFAGLDLDLEQYSGVVPEILLDLRFRQTMNESSAFAETLLAHFARQKVRILPRKPHRSAGFVVLKAPDVPSVLVELGYLSNKDDRKLLATPDFRRRVARAIIGAADDFFKRKDQLSATD
ncbi:hypothetical protein LCGC14_3050520, partial [marine sediment metagenome]